jgi:hypothetical protein
MDIQKACRPRAAMAIYLTSCKTAVFLQLHCKNQGISCMPQLFKDATMALQSPIPATDTNPAPTEALLHELYQARLHVQSLRNMNEQTDLEAGELNGMHLMLGNAETILRIAISRIAVRR